MKKQIAFFVCLLASGVLGRAQSAPACSVFGQVVAPHPTILNSFHVSLYDSAQHSRVAMLNVTSDGSFAGADIAPGQYMISVETDRNEKIVERMVQVGPASSPITLQLPAESGFPPPSGTVSLQRLTHRVPARAVKAFQRSQQASRSGDQAASFARLQDALAADPDFFEARLNLGAAYMASNETRRAIEQFAYAVKLDPSSVPAWTDMAIAQLYTGDGERAEESARRALRLDPVSVSANYALAVSWVMQRHFDQPILSHLESAYSQYPHARIVAAQALAALGKLAEARTQVETYLQSRDVPDRAKVEEFLRRLK